MNSKRFVFILGLVLLAAAFFFGWLKFHDVFGNEPASTPPPTQTSPIQEQPASPPEQTQFNKTQHSLDDPASIWVVVNKTRPLNPKNFTPANLMFPNVPLRVPGNESMRIRADVAPAIKELFDGATAAGHSLMFSSGFRSYNYQVSLYGGYVNSMGQASADTQSARPGYSEHQTGLAFDVCTRTGCKLEQAFGATETGKWVAAHAHEYGFILRYPEGKTDVTGYTYEPWHLRYVGKDLSNEMHKQGIQTLEEFFGLPAAPDYL